MPEGPKTARKQWVIVGIVVLIVAAVALAPASFRQQMTDSLRAFIIKIHGSHGSRG